MVREINLRRHVAVLIIVALVFTVGVFIGMRQGLDSVAALAGDYESIYMNSAMMDTIFLMEGSEIGPNESCMSYSYLFDRYNSDLAAFNTRLWEAEQRLGRQDPALFSLKDKFNTMEVRNYLLLRKVDSLCGANHTVVLYFYSNKNYNPEKDQGAIIQSAISGMAEKPVVYHFDIDVKNPAVDVLVRHYQVDVVPSMVVDGKLFEGYRGINQTKEMLAAGS
jgi:hypothetical protein